MAVKLTFKNGGVQKFSFVCMHLMGGGSKNVHVQQGVKGVYKYLTFFDIFLVYSNNGISTIHSIVYNSVVGYRYTTVKKNFSGPPPHFGMTPRKSGGVFAKCRWVLKIK